MVSLFFTIFQRQFAILPEFLLHERLKLQMSFDYFG